jgi:type II secretory pathway component PulF
MGFLILIVAFLQLKRTKKGALLWDRFKISAPVFGKIFKNMAISRFCHVLETLNKTGVPILESLTISSRSTGNSYIKEKLANTKSDVSLGHKIAVSLDKYGGDIFEAQMIKMIQVGEDAASLDDMLAEIAIMVDNETQTRVKTLTSTLEPIITVIMGAMILVLALSIFLPIWDMYESLANN